MSVNPSVATSAVRAPAPSSSALVTTVVPWAKTSTSLAERPAFSSAAVTAAITPSDWSWGVVGDLAVMMRPSSASTASVKVPPTSTPRSTGRTVSDLVGGCALYGSRAAVKYTPSGEKG